MLVVNHVDIDCADETTVAFACSLDKGLNIIQLLIGIALV